ncbi:MAG: hemerythrin domain-containing protein [Caulobacteraceae bacterium]
MPDAQDAIALLKADHRTVEELFAKFDKASGSEQKQRLAKQICLELVVHSMIEEEIFYPTFRGRIPDDLLDEAYVEHDGAKVLIAEIDASGPDAEFYDAKVKVLQEEIEHHVQEEEKPGEGIFYEARNTGEDMAALGERMRMRKEELVARFQSEGLPAPETRTFSGAEVEYGEELDEPADRASGGMTGRSPVV